MKNFTQVPNSICLDSRLSGNALRMLMYIMSKNTLKTWKFSSNDIKTQLNLTRNEYNRARKILIELEYLIEPGHKSTRITFYVNPKVYEDHKLVRKVYVEPEFIVIDDDDPLLHTPIPPNPPLVFPRETSCEEDYDMGGEIVEEEQEYYDKQDPLVFPRETNSVPLVFPRETLSNTKRALSPDTPSSLVSNTDISRPVKIPKEGSTQSFILSLIEEQKNGTKYVDEDVDDDYCIVAPIAYKLGEGQGF